MNLSNAIDCCRDVATNHLNAGKFLEIHLSPNNEVEGPRLRTTVGTS